MTSLSLFTFTHWRKKWQPTPVFLPGESQGVPGGLRLWGRIESDTTEATWQQQQQFSYLFRKHLLCHANCFQLGYLPVLNFRAAAMTLRTVLLSLQALLAAAEPDDPQDAVVANQVR